MMNIDGDMELLNANGGKKGLFQKQPVIKNDMRGANFSKITIEEGKPEIMLELKYDDEDDSKRTYVLNNP